MRRRLAAVFALVVGAATLALAIAVAMTEFPRGRRPTFEVDADQPVPAGVDGEALVLDAPLHFRIRPEVLWLGSGSATARSQQAQQQKGQNEQPNGDHREGAA